MKDYQKLRSGSDVRGVALEGIEGEHINLTDEAVYDIVRAFVYYLSLKMNKSSFNIAIGYDSRLSAKRIEEVAVNDVKKAIDWGYENKYFKELKERKD